MKEKDRKREIVTIREKDLALRKSSDLIARGLQEIKNLVFQGHCIRAIIVDDARRKVRRLRQIIDQQPDMEVVGVAYNGEEGVKKCSIMKSDVVIMNGEMPKMDGIEATRRILKIRPNIKVIFESQWFNEGYYPLVVVSNYVRKVQGIGASAWHAIPPESVTELIETIRRVVRRPQDAGLADIGNGIGFPGIMVKIVAYQSDRRWIEIKRALDRIGCNVWVVTTRSSGKNINIKQLQEDLKVNADVTVVSSGIFWGHVNRASSHLMPRAVVITLNPYLEATWFNKPDHIVRWEKGYLENLIKVIRKLKFGNASEVDHTKSNHFRENSTKGNTIGTPRIIALVSCGRRKRHHSTKARNLYSSSLFDKASAYAEKVSDAWYILSAKYGLLEPDAVISPYDRALNTMPADEREIWGEKVIGELNKIMKKGDHVVMLAGRRYREYLLDAIKEMGCTFEIPMEGLLIGEQMRWLKKRLDKVDIEKSKMRLVDIRRFYTLLRKLVDRLGGTRDLQNSNGRMKWPQLGVYFFFEPGEFRTDSGSGLRVVRVGAQALREGVKASLWERLRRHRGFIRGKFAGGGNHRCSIFRRHVGSAFINRDDWPEPVVTSWGVGNNALEDVRRAEYELEKIVSDHIREMPFLWLKVDDIYNRVGDRGIIETNAIALLSNYPHVGTSMESSLCIDPPSEEWLGRWAKSERVARSGFWNANHVDEDYDPDFLDIMEAYIQDA